MALIERQVTIAAPIDVVYRTSQDYAVRYDWDPFPEDIDAIVAKPGFLRFVLEGLKAYCESHAGPQRQLK